MGIVIPQVVTEDRASSALVIDGSLRFDSSKSQSLTRTPGGAGNRKTWTYSAWVKTVPSAFSAANHQNLFSVDSGSANNNQRMHLFFGNSSDKIQHDLHSSSPRVSAAQYRDVGGWYHVVVRFDTLQAAARDQIAWFINGEQILNWDTESALTQNDDYAVNGAYLHRIGANNAAGPGQFWDGHMSQVYMIDGMALGPEYFGYTDPLTNTWRPKNFKAQGTTINDGTQWSSGGGSGLYGSSSWGPTFDGIPASTGSDVAQSAYVTNSGTSTVTFSKPISGVLRFRACQGSNSASTGSARPFVTLSDGQEIRVDGANNAPSNHSFGYVSGITSVTITGTSSQGMNLLSLTVDGVLMKDSTTQNLAFGTNGFYLPMDGNSEIGKDKSGNGNNWTPVNFGGSAALDKATGGKPILSTVDGGTVASAGVFGSEASKTYTVTVASVDGGNRYHFDGVDRPNITLIRGATYTFDQSDSSNSSGGTHPLRFATAADAAGSSQYTDGVATNGTPGQAGAYTKITVPHNAPDTLYYYCTNHGGMGSSTIQITDETKADPYAWKNVLAMPLIGNGADMSGLVNCTTSTKTITAGGSPAADYNSNFYLSAIDFTASSTTGYYPTGAQSDFTFGTNDFTIEFWFKPTTTSRQYMTDFRNNGSGSGSGNNKPFVIFADNGSDGNGTKIRYANDTSSPNMDLLGGVGLPPSNTWHHLAIVRSSGTVYGYLNGVLYNSATDNTNYSTNDSVTIGNSSGVSLNFAGSLQDYRIYNGVAKYTSNFIPASTNPNIVPDSPSGVATKSKLKKVTDGAVSFDGNGDALRVADHADLRFGTGAFTIECFVYFNSFDDTYPSIISKYTGGTASWIMRVKSNGKAIFYSAVGGGSNNESSTDPIKLKKWHHIAMVREGTGSNQSKMYVDGKLVVTCTDGTDYTDTQEVTIGAQNASDSNVLNGFMSNVRIIKGTALYTGEFAPPTKTLTSVTNTKLLCCQSNSSTTTAAVIPTGSITVAGNPIATNFNPLNTDISTVLGQESRYATLNPLIKINGGSSVFGDNNFSLRGGSTNGATASTFNPTSGKHYFELDIDYVSGQTQGNMGVGVVNEYLYGVGNPSGNSYPSTFCGFFTRTEINSVVNGSETGDQTTEPTVNYTWGLAVDYDAKSMTLYLDGKKGNTVSFSSVTTPLLYFLWGNTNNTMVVNFGQKPFKFPPPDGFQLVSASALIPDDIVTRSNKYFTTTLYVGNGASSPGASGGTQTINVGLKPDLIWIKDRTQDHDHNLIDTIRGAGSILMSNATTAPPITNSTDAVTAFTDKGFTLGDNGEGTQSLELNKNGNNYVVWSWVAGGTPTATNTQTSGAMTANSVSVDGVLQSAYTPSGSPTIYPKKMSVGTKQGFSIIEYGGNSTSGAKVPHGLTQAPDFMVIKTTTLNGQGWGTYHQGIGATKYLQLQVTDHQSNDYAGFLNNTAPTNQVFTLGNDNFVNTGNTYMAYCWHDVPGLQKFGTYIGQSGNNFVELGFRPAMVWAKRVLANSSGDASDAYTSWTIMDDKRLNFNGKNPNHMYCNRARAEGYRGNGSDTSSFTHMLLEPHANGFFMNGPGSEVNASTGKYIYCAWAEQPSFNLYGAQSNAR